MLKEEEKKVEGERTTEKNDKRLKADSLSPYKYFSTAKDRTNT